MSEFEFLPTLEELESGIPTAPAPPIDEQRRLIRKVATELGFIDADTQVDTILAKAQWDGIEQTLKVDGRKLHHHFKNLAKESPELARSDGEARLESTLLTANLRSDFSLLDTPKAKSKFIAKFGQARYAEIQLKSFERKHAAEAKAQEQRLAAKRTARMQAQQRSPNTRFGF